MGFAAWWDSLDALLQVLYCIAVPASAVLLIQTALTLIGFGHGNMDVDAGDISDMGTVDVGTHDGSTHLDFDVLRLFSLQSVVAFLTVFGWTAIIAYHSGLSALLSLLIAFILGVGAMYGVAKLIQLSTRLAASGNITLKNALGQTARVYIPIPPNGQGGGKVNLTLQERFIEANAVTDGDAVIPSGSFVRIVDVRADVLVVEKD